MPIFVTIDPRSRTIVENLTTGGDIKKHRTNILSALSRHGATVVRALEDVITSGTRSGKVYSYKGRKYTASAPGEPPANRSGRLASSFGFKRTVNELSIFSKAFADNGYEYPWGLEMGNSRIKPRPYFVKTIQEKGVELKNELYKMGVV